MRSEDCTVGLALGGGAARGWSHIGIINELADMGIEPDVICGCSIGAIVGASSVTGNLARLEEWVCQFTRRDIISFLELGFSFNGFVDADRMRSFMTGYVCDADQMIDHLPKTFATVSSELSTGREIWFTEGSIIDAVWASMSLPGLFPPLKLDGRWLVDGGLVNPVPVSVCRALGADIVIAVNLNEGMVGRHSQRRVRRIHAEAGIGAASDEARADVSADSLDSLLGNGGMLDTWTKNIKSYSSTLFSNDNDSEDEDSESPPNVFDAIAGAINITQDRITRSRLAGDPPDITLSPSLSHIGLLEFFRASEAIEEGRACVRRKSAAINRVMGLPVE